VLRGVQRNRRAHHLERVDLELAQPTVREVDDGGARDAEPRGGGGELGAPGEAVDRRG
jgi:hypothetical protein